MQTVLGTSGTIPPMSAFDRRIAEAAQLVRGAKRLAAFTGAGISTESGISDFRSPGGVWDRYRIVTFQEFLSSHEARVEYWAMKRDLFREMKHAVPNKAHRALAGLERSGRLRCLITQNIDGLHQDAGSREVIELHGTNRKAHCLQCGKTWPIEVIQVWLEAGNLDPACDVCAGLVKPATVSFGQTMPEGELMRAFRFAGGSDVFLMIGSSLQVEPAASIPREAHRAGANLIFINRTETPWDRLATIVFREAAGDVLEGVVRALGEEPSAGPGGFP
jgi:NAD-dependent deacetylase